MLCNNIIAVLAVAFVGFGAGTPIEKRALKVFSDKGSVSITPAIKTQPASKVGQDIGGKADVVDAIAGIVVKVTALVQGLVDADIKRRQRFTQETVSAVETQYPGQTVVMSNVGYSLSCNPVAKTGASYKAKVGKNVSYDVLILGKGCKFTLKGDGGFENWAYVTGGTCKGSGESINC